MKYLLARYATGATRYGAMVLKGFAAVDAKSGKVAARFSTKREALKWLKLNNAAIGEQ